MAEVKINIDAMRVLVSSLEKAIATGTRAASSLRAGLYDVDLSCAKLGSFNYGGSDILWLNQILADCKKRLAKAEQLAGTRPGVHVVTFDESVFEQEDAQKAADLINQHTDLPNLPPEVLQQLIDLLAAHKDDPQFAADLAAKLSPEQLAMFITQLNSLRNKLVGKVDSGTATKADLDAFDVKYDRFLDSVAASLSLASRNMSPEQLEEFTKQFQQVFRNGKSMQAPAALSLVIGRGAWPDEFLTGITDTILDTAGSAEQWGRADFPIVDPKFNADLGLKPVVRDPLAGVFESAANYSPWWLSDYFSGNGDENLDLPAYDNKGLHADAKTVKIDSRLKLLMTQYGFDQSSGYWLGQAGYKAMLWNSKTGGPDKFATDLALAVEYLTRQSVIEDNKTFWEKNGHYVLMDAGMMLAAVGFVVAPESFPALIALAAADMAIGIADSALYFHEGDDINGAIALGFTLIPVAVGAAGLVKWVALSKSEIEAIRAGQTITRDGETINQAIINAALGPVGTLSGYPVNKVVTSGKKGLWKMIPFQRGNFIDKLLGNNLGHNFPRIDKFDPKTGAATSIKSLDTTSKSYQTTSKLQSTLKKDIDQLVGFSGNTSGRIIIKSNQIKSRALEVAIPDAPLTTAQKQALNAAKTYAKSKGVTIVLTVVK